TLDELITIVGPVASRPTGMALFRYENDTWMFTVLGMVGHEPPLVDVCRAHYRESRWRRYDKMRRFPEGLLVLGDAMCSFNPIYGQGMTVAALQAQALGECLRGGSNDLARRYFRAAAKPIGVAWQFAVGGDLNLPEVEGRRTLATRLSNRYVDRLQTVAETDMVVAEQFARVVALLDPPERLLYPRMLLRAARPRRRLQTEAQPTLARQ
ncbi:MAG: hypothetical protein QOJ20_4031, partial [Mycobacterium sp.]|nr:hypothetical protein [Mycobacterium sp.]